MTFTGDRATATLQLPSKPGRYFLQIKGAEPPRAEGAEPWNRSLFWAPLYVGVEEPLIADEFIRKPPPNHPDRSAWPVQIQTAYNAERQKLGRAPLAFQQEASLIAQADERRARRRLGGHAARSHDRPAPRGGGPPAARPHALVRMAGVRFGIHPDATAPALGAFPGAQAQPLGARARHLAPDVAPRGHGLRPHGVRLRACQGRPPARPGAHPHRDRGAGEGRHARAPRARRQALRRRAGPRGRGVCGRRAPHQRRGDLGQGEDSPRRPPQPDGELRPELRHRERPTSPTSRSPSLRARTRRWESASARARWRAAPAPPT